MPGTRTVGALYAPDDNNNNDTASVRWVRPLAFSWKHESVNLDKAYLLVAMSDAVAAEETGNAGRSGPLRCARSCSPPREGQLPRLSLA